MSIPNIVFIVPYRNRLNQKEEFLNNMKILLEDITDIYEIYFAHQLDTRPFNRGAIKNLGFIAIKNKYPNNYKDITFIFNDVDTLPTEKGMIDYNTTHGIVKHYYGFQFALGGFFSIKGSDFEKIKGFPNFWGWGLEDNILNDRCISSGLLIDRSCFYNIGDKRINHKFDGYNRLVSKRDANIYKYETPDNISDITNIKYNIQNEFINITSFNCLMNDNDQVYYNYDIRQGNKIKVDPRYRRRVWDMNKIINFKK
jgi:hypothetical protein